MQYWMLGKAQQRAQETKPMKMCTLHLCLQSFNIQD